MLVLFTGLPGTGKSTLAEGLAVTMGAPAFSGDWLMGALKPYGVLDHVDRPTYLDMYYNLIASLMERQLMLGQSAIIDCVATEDRILSWQQVAARYDAQVRVVECVCSDLDAHRSRLVGRTRNIPGWHEVGWDHVERLRSRLPALTLEHLTLDAVDSVAHNAQLLSGYLAEQ